MQPPQPTQTRAVVAHMPWPIAPLPSASEGSNYLWQKHNVKCDGFRCHAISLCHPRIGKQGRPSVAPLLARLNCMCAFYRHRQAKGLLRGGCLPASHLPTS
eukprot:351323-Chlamydomonas_euryale.AAC.14